MLLIELFDTKPKIKQTPGKQPVTESVNKPVKAKNTTSAIPKKQNPPLVAS